MDDFVARLRQIRREKDLSLDDCGQAVGIPAQLLAMIELGEVIPTEQQKNAIIEYILDQI